MGTDDGLAVAAGDGLRRGDAVMVGACVGTDAPGDGAGDSEPGAIPQLATTRAAASITLALEPGTRRSRLIT